MRPSNHPGHILPQDTRPGDANEEVIIGQPVSLSEVDELLYGDDRSAELRLDRLREIADQLRSRAAGEVADDDAGSLLVEIERAISSLASKNAFVGEPGMLDDDPLDHRETLSPDSDELDEIEEEDEESMDGSEMLDADEWGEDEADDDDEEDGASRTRRSMH